MHEMLNFSIFSLITLISAQIFPLTFLPLLLFQKFQKNVHNLVDLIMNNLHVDHFYQFIHYQSQILVLAKIHNFHLFHSTIPVAKFSGS